MTSKWITYRPEVAGRPPIVGFRPADFEVQIESVDGTWRRTAMPVWSVSFDYRYRPRTPPTTNSLPEAAAVRNAYPMADGLLDYFPNALAEVSRVSFIGNQQHNPGEPMHWARSKSTDHRNKIMRHLIDAGGKDKRGVRHSAALAWRALALLQEELEREEGVPMSRGSRSSQDPRTPGRAEAYRRAAEMVGG